MNIPAFKSHFHVEVFPGEGVLLLSEADSRALHGRAYELVAPLVDGRRSAGEIVDALAGRVDAATVYYVLTLLESKGYLTGAAPEIPAVEAAFWHGTDIEPRTALAALRDRKVAVLAAGGLDPAGMHSALEAAGVQTGPQESAHLWLVLTDDYQREELAAINETALQGAHPWLLVRATGPQLWLGPLFIPGETGCWQCLCLRLKRNRLTHTFVAAKRGLSTPPLTASGCLPSTRAAVYQMAATAAAQFLAGAPGALAGKVLSLDWASWTPQTHRLLRHPHCPACGTAEVPAVKPLALQPGKASFTSDGGHRLVAPERTLKKYGHLISPITGVVTLLEPALRDEEVAHVFVAGHNSALKTERLDFLKRSLRSASSGKGVSGIQARVSALCEAIERYSGELSGGEARVTCALKDWPPGQAYHPNDIMLYSAKQYAEREAWNKRGSRFNRVPEPFTPELVVDWTPLWSLTQERHKYVPTQLVYYGAPARAGDDTFYAVGCSNGSASGNTPAEAVLQGFFELVERDATALWWYNR
ncbi:TOMM precursor leader peptide-binding protein, partial [Pelotomaculum propionicicum]|uniref:TOMM precursor leader peptide-binding protein n=1 Tax=Pelotomaculum propionicicum TaxID=258475 RepID=UPI001066C97B